MSAQCGVVGPAEGQTCDQPSADEWDADDLIGWINEEWKAQDIQLQMTTPFICQEHMDMTPEL